MRALGASLWWGLCTLAVLLGCAVAVVPFAPGFPGAELDSAWMFAVNAAVAQGLAFGRDLIFTFGPYSDLYTLNYHPATDPSAMAASLVLAVALAAGLLALSAEHGRWRAALVAVLLNLLWLRDPLFFMVPLVFLAMVARAVARRRPLGRTGAVALVLLASALGLLPLVKGTFAAAAGVALALGGLTLLVRGRWRLAFGLALVFVASLAMAWLGVHQKLTDLPAFFAAQGQIVDGYTDAMALPGPAWQVAAFGAAALALLLLNIRAARRAGVPGWAVLAGAAALLLLAFKAGFVRQDEHVAIAAGALAFTAGALAVAHRGRLPLLGLLAGLLGWAVLDYSAEGMGPRRAMLRLETAFHDAAAGVLDRLRGGAGLQLGYQAALARIRQQHPVPALAGSSDIYSTGQSVLLAHGLAWSPRPVLQSYSAYSPALQQEDAAHLLGPAAPDNILLRLEAIDGRLPALEDGLSWLPMQARYQAVLSQGGMVVLRHLAEPDSAALLGTKLPAVQHRLGEAVALDTAGGPLWAVLDVQPSWLGRAVAAVFKPPPLRIVLHLADGSVESFRYVAGMGRAGFLISPVVGSAAQLVTLQVPGADVFADSVASSFSIEGDPRFWRADYTMVLAPLHVPSRPGVRSVVFPAPQPMAPGHGAPGAKCWLDRVNGKVVDHAAPLVLGGMVRLNGWGFAEAGGAGLEPEMTAVSLQGPDAAVSTAPAVLQARPDVGAFFHQPNLLRIGFEALLDLRGLAGTTALGLEMTADGKRWSCGLFAPVSLVPAAP